MTDRPRTSSPWDENLVPIAFGASAAPDDVPAEIQDFLRNTDPYTNMLPGISNIRAAETLGSGVGAGRRNPLVLALSLILVVSFVILPIVFQVLPQVARH
jgi:hypothetical protein